MQNRISIEPVHGMSSGTDTPCPACGESYCLADYVDATDHAIGKKYSFAILTCKCGLVRNKSNLSKTLPTNIYRAALFN